MGQSEVKGAKLALYLGGRLAVILRDERPGLPFAGYWDLPGGGREGDETALACALRECREELGLVVPQETVSWSRGFATPDGEKWFFVAHLPAEAVNDVVFGDEGQRWALMSTQEFLAHPRAVPDFQARLRVWLQEKGEDFTKKGPPLP